MILPRLESLSKRRLYTQGSPRLNVTISDIATTAQKLYGFEDNSDIRRYLPLNYLRIVNDSGEDLKVYVGQVSQEIIKNNSIFTHHGNFYSFILENIGSGTATGAQIYTTIQRIPTGG